MFFDLSTFNFCQLDLESDKLAVAGSDRDCSGQVFPDSKLSLFSAAAGLKPLL